MHSFLQAPSFGIVSSVDTRVLREQYGEVFEGPGSALQDSPFPLPRLSSSHKDVLERAKKYAFEETVKHLLGNQQLQEQSLQATSMKRAQALVLLSRIYVGSINYDIREEQIKQLLLPCGPVRSVTMSYDAMTGKHKGFAFLEFETPEAAALALEQMTSAMLGGRQVKMGRPSNVPQAQDVIDEILREAHYYHRIYVASIHPDLAESDVRSVFSVFGTIKSIRLPQEPTRPGKHRGYAYIEYESEQQCTDAITAMNLFDLGGLPLRVTRALTAPNAIRLPPSAALPSAVGNAVANISAKVFGKEAELSGSGKLASFRTASYADSPETLAAFNNMPPVMIVPRLGGTPIQVPAEAVLVPLTKPIDSAAALIAPAPSAPAAAVASNPAAVAHAKAAKLAKLGDIARTVEHGIDIMDDSNVTIDSLESGVRIRDKQQRAAIMQKLAQRAADEPPLTQAPPSRVVLLRNMVKPENVDEMLQDEVTEECSKFGEVKKVIIYQEKESESADAAVNVKVFVEYVDVASAQRARSSLDQRFFGGSQILATIYSQASYDSNDLSL